jgi:hypothetical protein
MSIALNLENARSQLGVYARSRFTVPARNLRSLSAQNKKLVPPYPRVFFYFPADDVIMSGRRDQGTSALIRMLTYHNKEEHY